MLTLRNRDLRRLRSDDRRRLGLFPWWWLDLLVSELRVALQAKRLSQTRLSILNRLKLRARSSKFRSKDVHFVLNVWVIRFHQVLNPCKSDLLEQWFLDQHIHSHSLHLLFTNVVQRLVMLPPPSDLLFNVSQVISRARKLNDIFRPNSWVKYFISNVQIDWDLIEFWRFKLEKPGDIFAVGLVVPIFKELCLVIFNIPCERINKYGWVQMC